METSPSLTQYALVAKRFFKLSELAGARWPNVTQDDIFAWHDAEISPPEPANNYLAMQEVIRKLLPGEEMSEMVHFAFDCCWFENGRIENLIQSLPHLCPGLDLTDNLAVNIENQWGRLRKRSLIDKCLIDFRKDHHRIDNRNRNLFSFWYFFLEFVAFRYATGLRGNNIDENFANNLIVQKRSDGASIVFINNSYFMLPPSEVKGFSHNETNQVRLVFLFDENGSCCIPARINTENGEWETCFTKIKKENLLLKGSTVRLVEVMVPEITSTSFRAKEGEYLATAQEVLPAIGESKNVLPKSDSGRILQGWKAIAEYAGCSDKTAQRRYRSAIRHSETGTIISTTTAIDEYILKTATRKKK